MSSVLVLLLALVLAVGLVAVSTRTEVTTETIDVGDCPECCVPAVCAGLPHAPATIHGTWTINGHALTATMVWDGSLDWVGTATCSVTVDGVTYTSSWDFYIRCPYLSNTTSECDPEPVLYVKPGGEVGAVITACMTIDSQDPIHLSASGSGEFPSICPFEAGDTFSWSFVATE